MGQSKLKTALWTKNFRERGAKPKKIPITSSVVRSDNGFEVCVRIGSGPGHALTICQDGPNPRSALGAALREASASVSGRRGAFAGLSKSKRRK